SDIIITSTSSISPVLPEDEQIFNGKLIIGIGSYLPHMREFSDTIYKNLDYLYVDTLDSIKESGDIIQPLQNNWLDSSKVVAFS
ncbi:ornithine cyclodeaminase family protein, partial [Alkalihalophilus pseudofirmus]|nr:ornithine cyclodeaminase family protein [Alkalihalophilus pseudofirmus]